MLTLTTVNIGMYYKKKTNSIDFKEATKSVESLIQNQATEWNKGNIEGYLSDYHNSDSTLFITSKGVKKGFVTLSESYKKSYNTPEKMGKLEFSEVDFRSLSNDNRLLYVTGNWKVESDTTYSGHFALLVKNFKVEGWKIITDHTW